VGARVDPGEEQDLAEGEGGQRATDHPDPTG
jgi:hypothetical protein